VPTEWARESTRRTRTKPDIHRHGDSRAVAETGSVAKSTCVNTRQPGPKRRTDCSHNKLAAETITSSLDFRPGPLKQLPTDAGSTDWRAKPGYCLSQGWLAIIEQHFMTDSRSQYVVDLLKPSKLGLEVADAPLQTTYF